MAKENPLNRMKGSMRGIPTRVWRSGSAAENNRINILVKIKKTKLAENLNIKNNECNTCRGNPPINNPV